MKFSGAVFVMQLRRLVRSAGMMAALLFLPAAVLLAGLLLPDGEGDGQVRAGFLTQGESPYAEALARHLEDGGDSLLFVRLREQGEMERRVAAGELECAYVIPADFVERVLAKRTAGMITRIQSPATSMAGLADEAVFAALLEACSTDMALSWLEASGYVDSAARAALQAFAEEAVLQTAVLRPDIVYVGEAAEVGRGGPSALAAAARGMTALALFLYSLLCAVRFSGDETSGFFRGVFPYRRRSGVVLPYLTAAAVPGFVSGLLSAAAGGALLSGYSAGPVAEILSMLAYMALLTGAALFLSGLLSGGRVLMTLLPFLMIACMLLCPILYDLRALGVAGAALAEWLPPTLYLRAAAGEAAKLPQMLLGGAALTLAGFALHVFRRSRAPGD